MLTAQNQPASTVPPPKNFSSEFKEQLEAVLRSHPELILDVLKEHEMATWKLVEEGGHKVRLQAEQDRRLAELANPKIPDLASHRPIRGHPDAPITIVEYSDFECPYCGVAYLTIKQLLGRYPETIRVFYKHNPLDFHPMAEPAAHYFEAIALQSHEQAWLFHDRVFEEQEQLQAGEPALQAIVASLNVDQQRFQRDLSSEQVVQQIVKDRKEAQRFGFDGTPAFLINGVSLPGAYPEEDFVEIIHMFMPNAGQPQSSTKSVKP
jgi:protein-disulfide isomerase